MRIATWEYPKKRFSFANAKGYIALERKRRDEKIRDIVNEAIVDAMSESKSETIVVFYQNIPIEVYDVEESLRLVVEELYANGFKVSSKKDASFQNAQGKTETADFVLTIGWNWKEEEEDNG